MLNIGQWFPQVESLIQSESIGICTKKRGTEKRAQIGKFLDALVSQGNRIFNMCRHCPVMIEESCLEDKSEVILAPGAVSRLDFVFRPTNRTLSKAIVDGEEKDCKEIRTAQSSWPAAAGVLVAAVISLVGFLFSCAV